MLDVAEDGDLQAAKIAELFAHGIEVEKRLGGMLVHAVAAVDDGGAHMLCQQVRRAAHRVANDDDVVFHRVKGVARIDERFALLHRTGGSGDVDRARAQIFCRQLERAAGAGAVFIKQRRHRAPLQVREFFEVLRQQFFHADGGIEDGEDILRRRVVQAEQIFL